LGPLPVCDEGKAIPVPAAKHRLLLAALLLQANRVISFDRLAEALWDAGPPAQARAAVRAGSLSRRRRRVFHPET